MLNCVYKILPAIVLLGLIFSTGCGTDASGNAILPPQDSRAFQTLSNAVESAANRSLLGFYEFRYQPDASSPLTVVPFRDSAFHLNIRGFLENQPCSDCLKVGNFVDTPGGFNFDLTIVNPFESADWYYGFDVRGIFFFNGSMSFPEMGVRFSSPLRGDAYLANPDGYTRLFNPTEFGGGGMIGYSRGKLVPQDMPDPNATIGAFKAFYSEGQSEDVGGRRAFFPQDSVMRTCEIVVPQDGPFVFGYAIDASWHPPMVNPPGGPDDFPPNANCLEPFRVDVEELSNFLTPDSGSVTLLIIAFDHQDASSITACRVEAPGLMTGVRVNSSPELIDQFTAAFTMQIQCESGSASTDGEEILIEILHNDPDVNLDHVSAWSYTIVAVENVPEKPIIDSIEPASGYKNDSVPVVIHGDGFHEGIDVQLYKGLVVIHGMDIAVVNFHTVEAVFDLAAPAGFYTLYMENPNGEWSEVQDAFEILAN